MEDEEFDQAMSAHVEEVERSAATTTETIALSQATASTGTPTQQFTQLYNRVQDLGEHIQIKAIQERKLRRSQITNLLPKKYTELDVLWNQNFCVGDAVLVKFTGESKRPTWPAEVVEILSAEFVVRWTSKDNLPPGQTMKDKYCVNDHRMATNYYRRAIEIMNAMHANDKQIASEC